MLMVVCRRGAHVRLQVRAGVWVYGPDPLSLRFGELQGLPQLIATHLDRY